MAIDESDGLEPAEAPTRRWTSRPPLPTERTLPHEAARAQVPFVDGEGRRENMDEADAIRHAKNEVLLRRYNEHVEAERMLVQPTLSEWVCECADERCAQPVKLSIAEYEAVRAEPTHFFVVPSDEHVAPEIEYVVGREPRYWVIAKIGVGAEISRREQEPRRT